MIQNNNSEAVALLLEGDASVDLANKNGTIPLYIASQKNSIEVVALLLALVHLTKGARVYSSESSQELQAHCCGRIT